jgi:hypothetical protein
MTAGAARQRCAQRSTPACKLLGSGVMGLHSPAGEDPCWLLPTCGHVLHAGDGGLPCELRCRQTFSHSLTSRSQPPGCLRHSAVRNLAGCSSCSCTPWLKGQSSPGACSSCQFKIVWVMGANRLLALGPCNTMNGCMAETCEAAHRIGRCHGGTWGRPLWYTQSDAGRAALHSR